MHAWCVIIPTVMGTSSSHPLTPGSLQALCLLLSLLRGSAPSLSTMHADQILPRLSAPLDSCLQPHRTCTPFSGLFPTVLYCSLAFFMSPSIVVCDLITSESLTAAPQGQEAKTVLHPLSFLAPLHLSEEQRSEVSLQHSDSPGSWKDR